MWKSILQHVAIPTAITTAATVTSAANPMPKPSPRQWSEGGSDLRLPSRRPPLVFSSVRAPHAARKYAVVARP
jgi:hypothetical protein